MITYKIFLGSSIDEFKTEREKIKSSINDMNQTFNKYGVNILVTSCEGENYVIDGKKGSQEYINEHVKNSDYSIFLIGKNLGIHTKEEFDIAYKTCKANKKLKIRVYFKKISSVNKKVKDFKCELDKKCKYYYSEFYDYKDIVPTIEYLISLQLHELSHPEVHKKFLHQL